jgi:arachidonate 15-lipoxygenase
MITPSLPQKDLNQQKRDDYLTQQKQIYKYDYDYLSPLVLMKDIPAVENFSAQYIAERVLASAELIPNQLAAKAKSFLDPLDKLQDYEDFFTLLPLPNVAKEYQTNNSFAEQRLSGANPLVLCLLNSTDARVNILQQISNVRKNFEPLFDISTEIAQGNIYVADYTGTDSKYKGPALVQGGTHEKGRKILPKPLAFFWWRRTGISDLGKLVPIAIQLNSSKTDSYTPFEKNPLDWTFAKICVQIADANHHEMNSHLCRTHFVMEPIAIGTARQLAENHPLSLLLRPHFRFMLTNNHLGQERLINRGGPVDELLAGTLVESMALVKDAYDEWNLKDFAFPEEIKNRGMDDTERLPHYPYRDDGKLVWDAIKAFVSSYLRHFYPALDDIENDTELQGWAKELSSDLVASEGGKVKGMPEKFSNVDDLIEIVTTIIFICGPQHSAVNYAQYEYMTFAANMPLAAYRDIPDRNSVPQEVITDNEILKLLPPYKRAADQLQSLFILSAYRYDKLGYYDKSFQELYHQKLNEVFNDGVNDAIIGIVNQFQQNLNIAEQKIDANNKKRVVDYPYLKPSLILNSISI